MIRQVLPVGAPREAVFQALTRFAEYPRWLPGCEKCEVLPGDGKATTIELTMHSLRRMRMVLRVESVPNQTVSFQLIRSTDVRSYVGSYRLMDAAGQSGTVVIAELEVDGGALAPRFLVDRMVQKGLEDTGAALNRYAASQEAPRAGAAQMTATDGRTLVEVYRTPNGYAVRIASEPVGRAPERPTIIAR